MLQGSAFTNQCNSNINCSLQGMGGGPGMLGAPGNSGFMVSFIIPKLVIIIQLCFSGCVLIGIEFFIRSCIN